MNLRYLLAIGLVFAVWFMSTMISVCVIAAIKADMLNQIEWIGAYVAGGWAANLFITLQYGNEQ